MQLCRVEHFFNISGVFSTGATGALAPVILGQYYSHLPLAPAILGKSITVSTRNSKVLNTPLNIHICPDFWA